jgi:hypothetical protein
LDDIGDDISEHLDDFDDVAVGDLGDFNDAEAVDEDLGDASLSLGCFGAVAGGIRIGDSAASAVFGFGYLL